MTCGFAFDVVTKWGSKKVPTASGATAVQIVHKRGRIVVDVDHTGSAHDDAGLELLLHVAHERLHVGQQALGLELSTANPQNAADAVAVSGRPVVEATGSRYGGLIDIRGAASTCASDCCRPCHRATAPSSPPRRALGCGGARQPDYGADALDLDVASSVQWIRTVVEVGGALYDVQGLPEVAGRASHDPAAGLACADHTGLDLAEWPTEGGQRPDFANEVGGPLSAHFVPHPHLAAVARPGRAALGGHAARTGREWGGTVDRR